MLAHAADPPPTVDLGWIKANQSSEGWQVTRSSEPVTGINSLSTGDVIVSVDDFDFTNLNALSAARILDRLTLDATRVTVLRNGSKTQLRLHETSEPLAKASAMVDIKNAIMYSRDAGFPDVRLPDLSGHMTEITFRDKWTLVHIWNSGCDSSEIAALNELANPSPEDLRVISIAMDDTPDSILQFKKREEIQFLNLLGGDYDGAAAKQLNYFRLRTDLLVSPGGHVVFVGNGPSSLPRAWSLFKQAAHSPQN
jgi:hypothetical protein